MERVPEHEGVELVVLVDNPRSLFVSATNKPNRHPFSYTYNATRGWSGGTLHLLVDRQLALLSLVITHHTKDIGSSKHWKLLNECKEVLLTPLA